MLWWVWRLTEMIIGKRGGGPACCRMSVVCLLGTGRVMGKILFCMFSVASSGPRGP